MHSHCDALAQKSEMKHQGGTLVSRKLMRVKEQISKVKSVFIYSEWWKTTDWQIVCFTCICCRSREVLPQAGTCLENTELRGERESGSYETQQTETCLPTEKKGSLASTQLCDLLSPLLSSPFLTEKSLLVAPLHASSVLSSHFSFPCLFYQ